MKRTILVVEDNEELAFGLQSNLEIEGYEVHVAGDGNAGHEAIAEASEAQEARIARFSASVRSGCDTTSLGCSKTVPGCSSAWKSNTLSWVAVVGRMFSSILDDVGGSPTERGRAAAEYLLKPPWLRAD